jgi:hypothetical protein
MLEQSEAALAAAAPAAKEEHDVASSGDLAGLHRRIRELEVRISPACRFRFGIFFIYDKILTYVDAAGGFDAQQGGARARGPARPPCE